MIDVDIRPVGDAAVLATLSSTIDEAVVRHVWSLRRELEVSRSAGVLDIVPAYASVLVRFDPFVTDLPRTLALVRGAVERATDVPSAKERRIVLTVCFGGECGVDFERAAHELGMREVRFRDAFCKPDYRVAFIGFVAGFPYLLGLPPPLSLPRLPSPRPRVPAGTVAIAAGQCGIYPRSSPGGWRLLGRTAVALFDPSKEPPALLAPGDVVRFVPVDSFEAAGAVRVEVPK